MLISCDIGDVMALQVLDDRVFPKLLGSLNIDQLFIKK